MPAFELLSSGHRDFVPYYSLLEKLWTGGRWLEGTVYLADTDTLVFSDIPNNRMLRYVEGGGVSVFRSPSGYSNGNTRDQQGRLVTCEHGERRLTRTELDGSVTVLADRWNGKRLNSPNDVTVKSDGTIWFTDPTYGILTDYEGHKARSEIGSCNVYRLDPATGDLKVVANDFDQPNGIGFSPDEKRLFVSDTGSSDDPAGPPHIRVFEVGEDHRLSRGRVFASMRQGHSDGFRFDTEGNLWTSAGAGVNCYSPEGEPVLRIPVPEPVANLCFGGPRRNRLFIAAHTSLYAIYVGKNGAQRP